MSGKHTPVSAAARRDEWQLSISTVGLPPVFTQLRSRQAEKLFWNMSLRTVPRGGDLFGYGEPAGRAYLLRTGAIAYLLEEPNQRLHTVQLHLAGSLLIPPAEPGAPQPWTARSLATSSSVVGWPVEVFREALAAEPALAHWHIEQLEARESAELKRRARYALLRRDPYRKVADLYWELGLPQPDGTRVMPFEPPRQVVAGMVGVTREDVSRAVTRLKSARLLHSVRGRPTVLAATLGVLALPGDYGLLI